MLVKDYWNLASLFVLPEFQGQGIASNLVSAALAVCRGKSPKGKVKLNSSTFAAEFYRKYGFQQIGDPRDLPGGCIPYEYGF